MGIRSRVFKVNKDSGEPDLLPAQQGKEPWMLVLSKGYKNRGKRFSSYKEAKLAGATLSEKYPDHEVTIVSRQVGYGPPWSKLPDPKLLEINLRGMLWCPYCRKLREFHLDPLWELMRCPVCRIPDHDYHVTKNNPILWKLEADLVE